MRSHSTHINFVLFGIVVVLSGRLFGQQLSCAKVHAMAQMARARSMSALNLTRPAAGSSYLTHLAFAFRALELHPSEVTASAVLDFLPQDDSHSEEWSSLSGWLCDKEQERDVVSLARLQARMPRDFAESVILLPKRMYQYVSYPAVMGLGPHDDYAEEMTAVCLKRHREFNAAVDHLPEKDKDWFLRVVFEPSDCRALYHPEAE